MDDAAKLISNACRRLALNLRQATGLGLHQICRPLLADIGRNRFDRLMDVNRGRLWPVECIGSLARIAVSIKGFTESEWLGHLLNPAKRSNPMIVEMISGHLFKERPSTFAKLDEILSKHLSDAAVITCCQRVLPVRHQTEHLAVADIQAQKASLGFDNEMALAKLNFAIRRQMDFQNNYNPGRTSTVLGMFRSGMQELRDCSGWCRYLAPEDAFEAIDSLAHDAIEERAIVYCEVNDSSGELRAELAAWSAPLLGIMAVDDRFIMKIYRNGERTFLERTSNRSLNRLLEEELKHLRDILSPDRQSTHTEMLGSLAKYAEHVEKTYTAIRGRKQEQQDPWNATPSIRVPLKVWIERE